MSVIKCDRRRAEFRDRPEVRERAAAALRRQLGDRLVLARDLVLLDRDRAFAVESCSTIGHFGMRHLADPVETSNLCDIGYALETFPDLEASLLEGRIPQRSAVFLGRLCRLKGALRPEDQWMELASTQPTRVVRQAVQARLEEVKRGVTGFVEISGHVRPPEAERFEEARVKASRQKGKSLTPGQTIAFLADYYLESKETGAAKRRMGPTAGKPESRAIPREVLRQLRARSGDRCEYPGCTNRVFVQKAHIQTPKAEGGGQEIDDLGHLCTFHHTLHDSGDFHLLAWTRNLRPIYRRRVGEILWPHGALEHPDRSGQVCDRSGRSRPPPARRTRPAGIAIET